jgi:hypothetical protein
MFITMIQVGFNLGSVIDPISGPNMIRDGWRGANLRRTSCRINKALSLLVVRQPDDGIS